MPHARRRCRGGVPCPPLRALGGLRAVGLGSSREPRPAVPPPLPCLRPCRAALALRGGPFSRPLHLESLRALATRGEGSPPSGLLESRSCACTSRTPRTWTSARWPSRVPRPQRRPEQFCLLKGAWLDSRPRVPRVPRPPALSAACGRESGPGGHWKLAEGSVAKTRESRIPAHEGRKMANKKLSAREKRFFSRSFSFPSFPLPFLSAVRTPV